jgi:hypothetical protein
VTDFDRQVRSKTHSTHALICLAAGKRLSKHLKMCIGPWLTSFNDSDRQVSRAAIESFHTVFDTEKKRDIVLEKYNGAVLKYISDVLNNETGKTISCPSTWLADLGDERFMSAEDMDARFSLVVGMCLAELANLVGMLHSMAISH